jgi:hypothetical protein
MDASRRAANSLPWTASLVRVPNFQQPDIEVFAIGGLRSNVDSILVADVNPTITIPYAGTGEFDTQGSVQLTTANGDLRIEGDDLLFNARRVYTVPATDYYDGAATVEQKIGSTWYPVVGRQIKAAPEDIRVNNGLIRIYGRTDATPALSGLSMESWVSGSTWGPTKTLGFSDLATILLGGPVSVRVIANRPEETIVEWRFPVAAGGTAYTVLHVEVRLRRGFRIADVSAYTSETVNWTLKANVAMSAWSGGGGWRANADDANAQRHVIFVRSAATLVGSNLEIDYTGADDRKSFGWGVTWPTGAGPWLGSADPRERWFAYVGETHHIAS